MEFFLNKINIRRYLKVLIFFCIVMLTLGGCAEEQGADEQIKVRFAEEETQEQAVEKGTSCFVPYTRSVSTKDKTFHFLFFCDEADKARWDRFNITSVYLKVGNYERKMQISTIEMDDQAVFQDYYRGILALEGSLEEECSGDMLLIVSMADTDHVREFKLGKCSVVVSTETKQSDIVQIQSSAVVKPDSDENIITYGNIVHIRTKEDINISSIDLALDGIGLDTKHYKIYSPPKFKKVSDRLGPMQGDKDFI